MTLHEPVLSGAAEPHSPGDDATRAGVEARRRAAADRDARIAEQLRLATLEFEFAALERRIERAKTVSFLLALLLLAAVVALVLRG